MSKNLCPENNITFENSYTIRFAEPIPAGEYTASAIVESTDTDSSVCLMLFYYVDGSTKEVYIGRSPVDSTERVFKTATFAQDVNRVRIYASEGYNPSVGDTATFTKLQIEAGNQMTDYVPYGEEPTPEPEPEPEDKEHEAEIVMYYAALAGEMSVDMLPGPSCRETMLLMEILDPSSYMAPVYEPKSRVEKYLFDIIEGGNSMLSNIPKSDKEKYLHLAIGGTVDEMPNPDACQLNYWMDRWIKHMKGE